MSYLVSPDSASFQAALFHGWAPAMSNLDSLAIHLIREGQWSDAILLYREELGVTVAQAEARVLALADEYEILYPGRWAAWFTLAFAGLSLAGLVFLLQLILSA